LYKILHLFSVLVLVVALVVPQQAMAQAGRRLAQAQNEMDGSELAGPRKQLATIIFSGLAGAILGLSTLSFYGRPQDRLSNIAVGFAVGVIAGTVYTTYEAARAPYKLYEIGSEEAELLFHPTDRWQEPYPKTLAFTIEF
jgi:hypothetical protein